MLWALAQLPEMQQYQLLLKLRVAILERRLTPGKRSALDALYTLHPDWDHESARRCRDAELFLQRQRQFEASLPKRLTAPPRADSAHKRQGRTRTASRRVRVGTSARRGPPREPDESDLAQPHGAAR